MGPSLVSDPMKLMIPLTPFQLTDGDFNYQLTFTVLDLGGHRAPTKSRSTATFSGSPTSLILIRFTIQSTTARNPGILSPGHHEFYFANNSSLTSLHKRQCFGFCH